MINETAFKKKGLPSRGRQFCGGFRTSIGRLNDTASCHHFAVVRGLRSDVPCQWSMKVRGSKRKTAHWQSTQLLTDRLVVGRHHQQPRQHPPRCTRALMKALRVGRSRWLNGLCRCLRSGCTNGTGKITHGTVRLAAVKRCELSLSCGSTGHSFSVPFASEFRR